MAKVTIYTTNTCVYCHAAKRLLKQKGVSYEEINVQGDEATRLWLKETTGQRTVPQIFINNQPIGGFDELSELDKKGDLDKALAQQSS